MGATTNTLAVYDKFANLFEVRYSVKKLYARPLSAGADTYKSQIARFHDKAVSLERTPDAEEIDATPAAVKDLVLRAFFDKMKSLGYELVGRYSAFRPSDEIDHQAKDVFRVFLGLECRMVPLGDKLALAINPRVVLRSAASVQSLVALRVDIPSLRDFSVYSTDPASGTLEGYLLETRVELGEARCLVRNFRTQKDHTLTASEVFPESRPEILDLMLELLGRPKSAVRLVRQHSMITSKTASKDRLARTLAIAQELSKTVFPLALAGESLELDTEPAIVRA